MRILAQRFVLASIVALGAAGLVVAWNPPLADEIVAHGWATCTILDAATGSHSLTSPTDSLPQYGVSVAIVDTNATKVTVDRTVTRKGNSSPASRLEQTTADCQLKYEIRRSTPVSSPSDVIFNVSLISNTGLSLTVDNTASGTKAGGEAFVLKPPSRSGPEEIGFLFSPTERSHGPVTKKYPLEFPGMTWTSYGSGSKAVFTFDVTTLGIAARAISGGAGGNATVASARSVASYKLYPSSFSVGSFPVGRIAGSAGTPGDFIFLDLYTAAGSPLSDYMAKIDSSGNYRVYPDEGSGSYRAYFYLAGTLRKRVDITYDSTTGLNGVNPSLVYGDLDGDNTITQSEADFVTSKIGCAAEWTYGEPYDARFADFDRDGTIEAAEAATANANVGLSGD